MDRFGWTTAKPPSGKGVGLGIGLDVGSYVALCLEADVQGSEVRVSRVVSALDCGLVVNPEGAANQMEGAIVMGLGTALYEAIDFENGRLLDSGFARYRVPRINNAPRSKSTSSATPPRPRPAPASPASCRWPRHWRAPSSTRPACASASCPIQRQL